MKKSQYRFPISIVYYLKSHVCGLSKFPNSITLISLTPKTLYLVAYYELCIMSPEFPHYCYSPSASFNFQIFNSAVIGV